MQKNDPSDLMTPAEVCALLGYRWHSPQTLAAASRRGHGPGGRVLVSPSRAAYVRDEVMAFLAREAAAEPARLAALRERAARARAGLAAKRAAKTPNDDVTTETRRRGREER